MYKQELHGFARIGGNMQGLNGAQHTHEPPSLTPKQARLVELLIDGKKIIDAASLLGVNESTIRRWLKLPHVDQSYQEAKDHLYKQVLVSLQKRSLETLRKHIVAEVEVTPSSQIRAVALIFEQTLLMEKLNEIEQKLAEFEELRAEW